MKFTKPLIIMGLPFIIVTIISHFLNNCQMFVGVSLLSILTILSIIFLKKAKKLFFCFIFISAIVALTSFLFQNNFGYKKLVSYADKEAVFQGKIVNINQNEKGTFCYTINVNNINNEKLLNKSSKINFYSIVPMELKINDNIKFCAIANKISSTSEFDTKEWYKQKEIYLFVFNAKNVMINQDRKFSFRRLAFETNKFFLNIIDENLSGEASALIKTIVFGEKNAISDEVLRDFNQAGILHITAISGLHISIIALFLKKIFGQRKFCLIITILLIWFFVAITNFRISAVRCATMQTILLAGNLFGRPSDSLNSLFFSAILILFENPFSIFDLAFALSFLSVLGIILFSRKINAFFVVNFKLKNNIFLFIASSLSCSLSVYICTLPVSIIVLNGVSIAGFFANIIIVPFTSIVFLSGLMLALSGISSNFFVIKFLLKKIVEASILFVCSIAKTFREFNLFVGTDFKIIKTATIILVCTIIIAILLHKFFKKEQIINITYSIITFVLTICILVYPLKFIEDKIEFKLISSYDSNAIVILHSGKSTIMTFNNDGLIINSIINFLDAKNVNLIENYIEINPKKENYTQFSFLAKTKIINSVWVDSGSAKNGLYDYCSRYCKNINLLNKSTIKYTSKNLEIIKNNENLFLNFCGKTMLITSSETVASLSNCEFLIYCEKTFPKNVKFPAKYVILLSESNFSKHQNQFSIAI